MDMFAWDVRRVHRLSVSSDQSDNSYKTSLLSATTCTSILKDEKMASWLDLSLFSTGRHDVYSRIESASRCQNPASSLRCM